MKFVAGTTKDICLLQGLLLERLMLVTVSRETRVFDKELL